MAWRQTHDSPNHGLTVDGPFSFCSFPFLLNPRAKSKLLHTEARCLMTQVRGSAWSQTPLKPSFSAVGCPSEVLKVAVQAELG